MRETGVSLARFARDTRGTVAVPRSFARIGLLSLGWVDTLAIPC